MKIGAIYTADYLLHEWVRAKLKEAYRDAFFNRRVHFSRLLSLAKTNPANSERLSITNAPPRPFLLLFLCQILCLPNHLSSIRF